MPMIDVYATTGTFTDTKKLATELATTLMRIEGVPDIPMFRQNTAAFIHEIPPATASNVDGDNTHVRVQVLTNAGALNREKQLTVVAEFTTLIGTAASDDTLKERTWVLLTEAVDGGWGLWGHAHTNDELVTAARAEIAKLGG
jgi:phenylpyruvate tautomerase PptA (4-oxalocrotonate tautomerase family)